MPASPSGKGSTKRRTTDGHGAKSERGSAMTKYLQTGSTPLEDFRAANKLIKKGVGFRRWTSGGIIIGPGGDYPDYDLWMSDTDDDLVDAGKCEGATFVRLTVQRLDVGSTAIEKGVRFRHLRPRDVVQRIQSSSSDKGRM